MRTERYALNDDVSPATIDSLGTLEKRLLDEFQHNFPLSEHPYADIAQRLDSDEKTVLAALGRLQFLGLVSRVGAVFTPHRAGWSTLAAMAVPEEQLESVARLVGDYPEVNHNYERDHHFNLWFVVTGHDDAAVAEVLREIAARTGMPILDLPLVEAYQLNLGFPLQWQ